jgi:hypothetical protein
MAPYETIIELSEDHNDAVHGTGHYEIVHVLDETNNPICGASDFRDPRSVKSKRIMRSRCLRCHRGIE